MKRNPFDGSSGFPSFFAAAKAPFGDSSSSSYNSPAPAPAPSYSVPAPSYSAPAPAPSYSAPAPSYSAPEPSYSAPAPSYPSPSYHQPQPTHNCSIQEETLEAQVRREKLKIDEQYRVKATNSYAVKFRSESEPIWKMTPKVIPQSESKSDWASVNCRGD